MVVTFPIYRQLRIKRNGEIERVFSHRILAAIDFNRRFLYLCTSWEGLARNSRVLRSVLQGSNADFPRPQNSKAIYR